MKSLAEWVCTRMYDRVWWLQEAWNLSDGYDLALRERSIRLNARYKKLCSVLDNR